MRRRKIVGRRTTRWQWKRRRGRRLAQLDWSLKPVILKCLKWECNYKRQLLEQQIVSSSAQCCWKTNSSRGLCTKCSSACRAYAVPVSSRWCTGAVAGSVQPWAPPLSAPVLLSEPPVIKATTTKNIPIILTKSHTPLSPQVNPNPPRRQSEGSTVFHPPSMCMDKQTWVESDWGNHLNIRCISKNTMWKKRGMEIHV